MVLGREMLIARHDGLVACVCKEIPPAMIEATDHEATYNSLLFEMRPGLALLLQAAADGGWVQQHSKGTSSYTAHDLFIYMTAAQ